MSSVAIRPCWKSDSGGAPRQVLEEERKAELLPHGPSQEAAYAVLLPTDRGLQLFYSHTFGAAEQVEADLLLRLFLDRRLGLACVPMAPFRRVCRFGAFAFLLF